jgi:hypothetical protein
VAHRWPGDPVVIEKKGRIGYDAAVMTVTHRPTTRPIRPRRAARAPIERGYLALTAALYPGGDAICAEILEFNIASFGDDFNHAYAMIVEAVEGAVRAAHEFPPDSLERFVAEYGLTVHPKPPRTYRPAAIPSHLLSQPGLILRPVSISIEAALRD